MGGGGSTDHEPNTVQVGGAPPPESVPPPNPPAERLRALRASRRYHSDEVTLTMPSVTEIRQALGDGPVRCPVTAVARPTPGAQSECVGGSVDVVGRGRAAVITGDQLQCSCGEPDCAHLQVTRAELIDRLQAAQIRTPERTAMRVVLAGLGQDLQASQAAQARAATAWPDTAEVSYTEDPAAFQAAYRQAQQRRRRGEPPVPFMTDDATGGLGARDGGRGFGVEIEFDFAPGVNQGVAMTAIGRDMHAAGLSRHAAQVGYHASMRDGYTDAGNAWQLESDCTVAGEIVSPIMYDEPQSWRNLATVCDIVKRHGGRATMRTGGHVHVSAHNYDHTVANHSRLMSLFRGHEDTLYRLAQNPGAQRHRGLSWCEPNNVPADGYRDVQDARVLNAGHNWGMNLQSVSGRANDHVEYRMWDGSLDPAVIQTQIKLSLGLTEAAFRGAAATSPAAVPAGEAVGNHRARNTSLPRGERLRGEPWRADTESFRRLADTVFHRAADKGQAASLFAVTRWQRYR